jgi:hypothetical protein
MASGLDRRHFNSRRHASRVTDRYEVSREKRKYEERSGVETAPRLGKLSRNLCTGLRPEDKMNIRCLCCNKSRDSSIPAFPSRQATPEKGMTSNGQLA